MLKKVMRMLQTAKIDATRRDGRPRLRPQDQVPVDVDGDERRWIGRGNKGSWHVEVCYGGGQGPPRPEAPID